MWPTLTWCEICVLYGAAGLEDSLREYAAETGMGPVEADRAYSRTLLEECAELGVGRGNHELIDACARELVIPVSADGGRG
ncbi:hypothetical protein QT341_21260 [Escherichia coli]|nr:hypothetical protein [Escherichia coli]